MSNTIPWRRHAVGAISLALVVAGIVIWYIPGASTNWAFAQGVFIKTGTTLLILWLAYPQLERLRHGREVECRAPPEAKEVAAVDSRGRLLAVLERSGENRFRPVRNFCARGGGAVHSA